MLNFLLLYVPVHPLKESYLIKFIQDAVKLQCLLPCYVVCFHYLIQSVLGMLLDLAKFNRGGIHWLHHMLHVFLYTEHVTLLASTTLSTYRIPATQVHPHRCHFILPLFRLQGNACLLFITQKLALDSGFSLAVRRLCDLWLSFLCFYLVKSFIYSSDSNRFRKKFI